MTAAGSAKPKMVPMQLSLQNFSSLVQTMAASVQAASRQLLDLTVGSVLRAVLEANASIALWMQWLILQVLQMTRAATSTGADLDSWMADFALVPAAGGPGDRHRDVLALHAVQRGAGAGRRAGAHRRRHADLRGDRGPGQPGLLGVAERLRAGERRRRAGCAGAGAARRQRWQRAGGQRHAARHRDAGRRRGVERGAVPERARRRGRQRLPRPVRQLSRQPLPRHAARGRLRDHLDPAGPAVHHPGEPGHHRRLAARQFRGHGR